MEKVGHMKAGGAVHELIHLLKGLQTIDFFLGEREGVRTSKPGGSVHELIHLLRGGANY